MTIFHFILSHDHIFSRGVPNKTLFARASRASTSRTGRRHALYVLLSLQRVAVRADVVDHRRDEREVARVARREGRHVLAGVRLDRQRVEAGDDEALRRGEEAEEADHREAAVVDLGEERLLLRNAKLKKRE